MTASSPPGRREARWQFDLAGYCAARLAAAGFGSRQRARRRHGRRRGAVLQPSPPHAWRWRTDRAPDFHDRARSEVAVLSRLSLLLSCCCSPSCGDLPEPFLGNPGANGRVLAQPPTPRLAVPPPANALLPDAASRQFADALAAGLQAQEVPGGRRTRCAPTTGSWSPPPNSAAATVVPMFRVLSPKGEEKGNTEGSPVPTAGLGGRRAGHAGPDRARRGAEDLRPAHQHPARRPEQPVQPDRQGSGRGGDRRAGRRQRRR